MTERPRGLGRGLGALFPTGPDSDTPSPSWAAVPGDGPAGAEDDAQSTTSGADGPGEQRHGPDAGRETPLPDQPRTDQTTGDAAPATDSAQSGLVPTRGA